MAGSVRVAGLFFVCVCLPAILPTGCGRTPQSRAASFLESGKLNFERKEYDRAIVQFKNAARLTPKDAEPLYRLALAYLEKGDVNEAVGQLIKASKLDPKHVPTQVKLTELMSYSSEPEVVRYAEKRAQELLSLSPDNPDALNALALAELRLGRPEDATRHLQQALADFPKHLNAAVTLANAKLALKDLAGAEEVLKKVAEQTPAKAEPALALGRFYLVVGKPAEAEVQFRRAVAIDPKFGQALLDLGRFQYGAGQKAQAEQTFRRLSAFREKQYRPWHAMFLFNEGQRDAAITEFEKLAREDPKDRDARTRLVSAYLAANRAFNAERVLSTALKANPSDVDALVQRAEILIMNGKHPEAEKDARQVLHFTPNSAAAHYVLSRVHQARGEVLNQRQELSEALRLQPDLLAVRLELARSLIQARSANVALDLMNKAPDAQRNTPPAIAVRNAALQALGDRAEARKGIDQGLAIARTPALLLQDGLWRLQGRDYAGARSSLNEVLSRNPDEIRALEILALSYVAQNQKPTALQIVREHAARRQKSAPVQYFSGQFLLRYGSRAEARAAFTSARAADPTFAAAGFALADMDAIDGNLDAARQALNALLASNQLPTAVQLRLGMLEESAHNYTAATGHYRKVVESDPRNPVALNNLAYLLTDHGNQPDEALKYAQQAIEVDPENPAIQDTLGWVYYHKGVYRSAIKYLEAAVLKEGNPRIKYHLAMACLRAGERERGKRTLEAALKAAPNLPEAKLAQAVLAETK